MEREELIRGLREAANFLEDNPNVPLNLFGRGEVTISGGVGYGDSANTKQLMSEVARTPGKWRKEYDKGNDGCLRLYREFSGGVVYQAYTQRSSVCTRKVVGTKRIEAKTIEAHDVEIVEWECDPILAPSEP